MIYKIAAYSDIGIVKKTNQDSVLMKVGTDKPWQGLSVRCM